MRMTSVRMTGKRRVAGGVLLLGLLTATWLPAPRADAGDADEALLEMIGELIREPDRDMRALGLQQVREQAPGESATRRFVELLPLLLPEPQAALIEALGERGDPVARSAVVAALDSDHREVRVAALRALGVLGGAGDVPRLATLAATGVPDEQRAAAEALLRLRGEDIHSAMVAIGESAQPGVRAQLLRALGARNATEALPAVIQAAGHRDPIVQTAALKALRQLASPGDTDQVVRLLNEPNLGTPAARERVLRILLTLGARGGETCVPALREGLDRVEEAGEIVLLQALARAGGSAALETVLDRFENGPPAVRREALRILSRWPDPALIPRLLEIAESDDLRQHVLALRGLVRLAETPGERPADAELLSRLWTLARRPDEQRLVLAAYGRAAGTDATLAELVSLLDDSPLVDEIALAIVAIADRADDSVAAGPALQRVLQTTQHAWARERAEQLLEEFSGSF